MIDYRPGKFQLSFIWSLRGSVFPRALVVSLPSAVLAVMIKVMMENGILDLTSQNNAAYSGFSFVVGFLLVFRTSQAYTRFWDGATKVHEMRSKWCDACGSLIAFTRKSKNPISEVEKIQHLFIRLFSLMHSLALQQIAVMENEHFVVIDVTSLDKASLEYIHKTPEHIRVEIVMSWIQQAIVDNIDSGLLPVPPPILSRVFQELSNGMVHMSNAQKISSIPFPFPYAQMTTVLLLFHWLLTPMLMCTWTPNLFFAFLFTFAPVFSFWCINMIAGELEQPFGDDVNDLPMHQMQEEINESLLLQIGAESGRVPFMLPHAVLDVNTLIAVPASSRPFTSIDISNLKAAPQTVTSMDGFQATPEVELKTCDIELLVQPKAPPATGKAPSINLSRLDKNSSSKFLSNGPVFSPGPNADVARDACTPDPHPLHYGSPRSSTAQKPIFGAPDPRPTFRMGASRSPATVTVRTPEHCLGPAGSPQTFVSRAGLAPIIASPVTVQTSRAGGVIFSPYQTDRSAVGSNLETGTSQSSHRPHYFDQGREALDMSLDVADEEFMPKGPRGVAKDSTKWEGSVARPGSLGRGLQALVKCKPEIPEMPSQYDGGMYIADLVDFGLPDGSDSP